MTLAFVVDASVAIGWVHPAQATAETAAVLSAVEDGATLEVPPLWPLDVANALTVLMRRGKLTSEDRRAALTFLGSLPIRLDENMASLAFTTLADLAEKHGLSVYDAVYLELADRRKMPLACKDGPLRKAARQRGLRLWTAGT
jgi:predicted nucleic acid-binding protein